MEIIYLDSLFLLNLVIDYLLLSCSATVCGLCVRRLRYLAGALLGAGYAVAAVLPGCGFLSSPVMKLVSALLMALAAYGGEKSLLRCALVFLSVSAAFAGFLYCITLAGGYPAFDLRTLLLAFAFCYLLLSFLFGRRVRRNDRQRVEVTLTLGGKSVRFLALVDTGNELRDPISGVPVLLVCPHAVAPLFVGHEELLRRDPVGFLEGADRLPMLKGRVRLIPYSAVGGTGMLGAFRPESVFVDGEAREAMAAISEKVWGDGYEGIV